ncbi:MAG: hypothetical protein ABI625_19490 [bacterium]
MPSRHRWSIALPICAPHFMDAQTVVLVRSSGAPIPGAEVAAWDSTGQIAAARTDGLGVAHVVPVRPIALGAFLLVRRMGFAPVARRATTCHGKVSTSTRL